MTNTHRDGDVFTGAPVRATFLPFHRPWLDDEDERAVIETLRSDWITTGPQTKQFEESFASYVGARACIGLNSCTAALFLALEAVGVDAGDEVITTPITFASTANVIVHRRATPVFVDVEPGTLNMDPGRLERAITPKTKAIIVVDFAGQPAALDEIGRIAARHGLVLIEDAAHAVGAEDRGRRVGGISDITCFSFYATKYITCGEGGALTTNDERIAKRVATMSLHGLSRDAWKRYGAQGYRHWDVLMPGYKYNMFDIQASLLASQFKKIEQFWERRRDLKAKFDAAFRFAPELQLPSERDDVKHAYHLYPVVFKTEQLSADRDTIMNAIQAENVGVGVHFRAVHLHPYYVEAWQFRRGMFPNAEYYSDRTVSLPLYPKMSDQDADDVIAAVTKVLARYRRT